MNKEYTNGYFDANKYFGFGLDKEIRERNGIKYIFNLIKNNWELYQEDNNPDFDIEEDENI